ncbi:MAG: LysE family translocator [Pseudomonadota bacterium]
MTLEIYLLYLAALAAFFATPPDVSQFLIISNSMRHGLCKSIATILGDLSANALQMTAAAFGLTAIIATSANAVFWVKWAGVAYLVWLGFKMLFKKSQAHNQQDASKSGNFFALFQQGFLTSSANPYAIVFFGALFPQFIDPAVAIGPQLLLLGVTYLIVDGLLLLGWGWLAVKTAGHFKAMGSLWINRISGLLMLGAAALLAGKSLELEPVAKEVQ